MMKDKETAVIIANWNGEHLLGDCLDSLFKQTYQLFEIIVVDNGSNDGSVEFIEEKYPTIKLIKLDENTGFAYANNLGISEALKEKTIKYVVVLNNDTKADKNYLKSLVGAAKRTGLAGSFQPKVINYFQKDIIDSTGILIYGNGSAVNRGYKKKDLGQYEEEEEIFGVSASAALYARQALEKTKLSNGEYFDNDYFAYNEDVDLAWRMRLAGCKAFYVPSAIIYHAHSATGESYSPFKAFHIHRNQYYNVIKNLPGKFLMRALFFVPIQYLHFVFSIFRKKGPAANLKKKGGKMNIFLIIVRVWVEVMKNFPVLIKKRNYIQKNRKVSTGDVGKWFSEFSAKTNDVFYR